MLNGTASQRKPSAPLTAGIGSSSWPTPRAVDASGDLKGSNATIEADGRMHRNGQNYSVPLCNAVKIVSWPTPRANKVGGYSSEGYRPTLEQAVKTWPTPTVQDSKNNAGPTRKSGRQADELNAAVGGALNPEWVEVLMGFPPGFTRLDD